MDRMFIAGLGAAVVLGGLAYAWTSGKPPDALPPAPLSVAVPSAEVVTVHVSGAVASPGVVAVADGARVADAIAAAGGATAKAQLSAINLAAPVSDGEQIVVPDESNASVSAVAGDGRVAVNRASAADLETLPGVGPVLAERIVEYRDTNGPFSTVEDLLDVTGIGEAKLASLRDRIRVP